jgi:predicted  nucleic acid-binding Zn-ribbon protein
MTNFIIKNDILFSLVKSEGTMDFPRKFFAKKVSGNQIKISTLGSNEVLLVDVWNLEDFTIDGASFTDVHEAIVALQPILWNEDVSIAPIDYSSYFTEIISEIKNDDSYQLFEDTDGNILFGKIDNDGIMKYYKADGSVYTGAVKPYSRDVAISYTDYCANSVPYTLVQFRDIDTKLVVATLWRNDNDLTESATAPSNSTKGVCVVEDLTGKDCATPMYSNVCNVDDIVDPITAKLDEVITALNTNSADEQAILTEISTKLDDLSLIKAELVTANTTLSGIKTDTAGINTNLTTVIARLDTQIVKLDELKVLVADGNAKIDLVNTTLSTISADIATIKTDISAIKADVSAIKTSTASIDTKLSTVVTSLASIETKLDTIHSDLTTINTTLQTEFDQTQAKLDDIKGAIELKGSDCANKVFTNICNFQELADAINAGGKDYTAVLDSIDGKLDDVALIKAELVTVNSNLLDIEANTAESNVKLDSVIAELDAQTVILTDIKAEAVAGNVKLDEIKTVLNTVSTDIATIKADVAIIKADISAIKTGVQSIDTKLTSVVTSLANVETKLDSVVTELQTINTTLQTEFDQTQAKLDELITAVQFANDTYQAVDCDGNIVGDPHDIKKVVVINKQTVKICNIQELADAINNGGVDNTALLTSIDTKLNDLALIKAELVTANTTLTDIKTNTASTNTKLDTVIAGLDAQTVLLTDIKAQAVAGNVKLDDIKALLTNVDSNITTIKSDLATIKTDISAIKTGVQSIDTKLSTVVTSLTSIEGKLDTLHSDLTTINTTLQTEFDQTQSKLDDVITAINATKAGKSQDLISWTATAGQTSTIPAGKFSTMVLFASKGEFTVKNQSNDFSTDITFSGGLLNDFIEISEDGIGTQTGSTGVPQSIDTRANANDMALANNSFLITCVRDGVLAFEVYK